jgi:hypothetical protein
MIDWDKVNEVNRKFIGSELHIDNIISIELRADLLNDKLVDDDFSVFFSKSHEDGSRYLSYINRIKNGLVKEFYLSDFATLQKNRFIEKKTWLRTNMDGAPMIDLLLKHCPDINGFRINDNIYNNNYDSVGLDGNHDDIYFYNWFSKDARKNHSRPLYLVDKKWYCKNYICEILRYNAATLELNKIYLTHNYRLDDDYPYPILKKYGAWQVFYYFSPDDLVTPKECLFDPRKNNPHTQEWFRNNLGTDDIPWWADPDTPIFDKISLDEAQWYWNSIVSGKDLNVSPDSPPV